MLHVYATYATMAMSCSACGVQNICALVYRVFFIILGGAPNYYPNSFSGPLDHPTHALSKTVVVSIMY